VADLELSLLSRICLRGRTRVHLTDSEFILLVELMRRHGQVLSRSMLAQRLWDSDNPSDSNVIDVNIHRIRSKIDDPFEVKLLHTVRTMGYVLEDRSEW
jgi:two-component system copper resistance phosphate regulon response regulator CusR